MPPHFDIALHWRLQEIARTTLSALGRARFEVAGTSYDLTSSLETLRAQTELVPADSSRLDAWNAGASKHSSPGRADNITFSQTSTLVALRRLASSGMRAGVLNFANAEHPGGGFQHGAQAQEESLARSSTLYASLTSERGTPFYSMHTTDPPGLYTHAMIWSPRVQFFRADDGSWLMPVEADVLTSPAVNAHEVRLRRRASGAADTEVLIANVMRERMTRILRLFELEQSTHLVLGSFGTGAFGNDVVTVARIWAQLLGPGSRYELSFDLVEFEIIDQRTHDLFKDQFEQCVAEMASQNHRPTAW